MEEIKIEELMDVIEFKGKPVSESVKREANGEDEEIRVYVPPREAKKKSVVLRFIITFVAFFLLFLCLAILIEDRGVCDAEDDEDYLSSAEMTDTSALEEITVSAPSAVYPPTVIDESKSGIEINLYNNEDYSLQPLLLACDGVKVLIIHSHNSEYVSESLSVSDAGSVISQLLTSAGIETYHCITEHDAEGNIGSYLRMKESVTELIERHPDAVCVIDIHDSDSGLPVTFTVGTGGVGWNENLRFAEAICGKMTGIETAFRFLPGALGQDGGILTLNVGMGGKGVPDDDARAIIATFVNALIKICNEKASAP